MNLNPLFCVCNEEIPCETYPTEGTRLRCPACGKLLIMKDGTLIADPTPTDESEPVENMTVTVDSSVAIYRTNGGPTIVTIWNNQATINGMPADMGDEQVQQAIYIYRTAKNLAPQIAAAIEAYTASMI